MADERATTARLPPDEIREYRRCIPPAAIISTSITPCFEDAPAGGASLKCDMRATALPVGLKSLALDLVSALRLVASDSDCARHGVVDLCCRGTSNRHISGVVSLCTLMRLDLGSPNGTTVQDNSQHGRHCSRRCTYTSCSLTFRSVWKSLTCAR